MTSDAQRRKTCGHVARIFEAERTRQGLSMTVLGARAGLSQQMVSYVERGMRNPSLDTLLRMADALHVDLAEIIRRATQRRS